MDPKQLTELTKETPTVNGTGSGGFAALLPMLLLVGVLLIVAPKVRPHK